MDQAKIFYLKYRFIIWPVVSGLFSIGIIGLVIVPQVLGYFETQDKITAIKSNVELLNAKVSELEMVDVKRVEEDLQVVFKILPQDPDVPEALVALQQLAEKANLQLNDTSFSQSNKSAKSFQLVASFTGRVQSVKDFLVYLQQSPRVMQVETIAAQFEKDGDLVELGLPVSVFYESTPKSIGSLEQPVPKLNDVDRQLVSKLSRFIPVASAGASLDLVPLGKTNPFD